MLTFQVCSLFPELIFLSTCFMLFLKGHPKPQSCVVSKSFPLKLSMVHYCLTLLSLPLGPLRASLLLYPPLLSLNSSGHDVLSLHVGFDVRFPDGVVEVQVQGAFTGHAAVAVAAASLPVW